MMGIIADSWRAGGVNKSGMPIGIALAPATNQEMWDANLTNYFPNSPGAPLVLQWNMVIVNVYATRIYTYKLSREYTHTHTHLYINSRFQML